MTRRSCVVSSVGIAVAGLTLVSIVSCGGLPTVSPAAARAPMSAPTSSAMFASTTSVTVSPTPAALDAPRLVSYLITGTAGPLRAGSAPCFADRFPCEVYDFSLPQEGSIDVAVTWEGPPRAMLVQLYWAGAGLAHEDVAPRNGPSRIHFHRPRMEAANYRIRVVNLEPTSTIPFTLTLTH